MIKQFDIVMGGRKLTRTLETAKVVHVSNHAEIVAFDASRFTHTDGAPQNSDRPCAF